MQKPQTLRQDLDTATDGVRSINFIGGLRRLPHAVGDVCPMCCGDLRRGGPGVIACPGCGERVFVSRRTRATMDDR